MRLFILILYTLIGYAARATYPKFDFPYIISGRAQGTTYDIKYYAPHRIVTKNEVDSIFRVIDNSMSLYDPNSLISSFNSSKTKKILLDDHMYNVVQASFKYHQLTKGYFDITVYPLLKLWGFGPEGYINNPNDFQVDSVLRYVGAHNLRLKGYTLNKMNKDVSIDLNGIAQGYTVDVLSEFLIRRGITSYIVEVGGEIYAQGLKPNGDSFKVEIQRPYEQGRPYIINLLNKSITTSGSYEKTRMVNGQRISHHFDPITGKPLINNTFSATVIADSAMEADALDNYLMYLQPHEAIRFIEKKTSCEAYIIYSENNTLKELQSSGFNNYIYNQQ